MMRDRRARDAWCAADILASRHTSSPLFSFHVLLKLFFIFLDKSDQQEAIIMAPVHP